MSTLPPPPAGPRPRVRRLRTLLDDAGYAAGPLSALLRASGDALVRQADVPVLRRRLAGDEGPLATLTRLLLLDGDVAADVAERALGAGAELLVELGLAAEAGGRLRGTARLVPHEDVLIASDLPVGGNPEHVAGVHRPSFLLANMTVRRPVGAALDVGTGNGIQAILLARHAERVVATDVNERALAFAGFNAALNGAEAVELRAGSFLEPVRGERFGVVVANPPYVISPESEFLFRDSGLGRDRVSEQLVRDLPSTLDDGAFATVLVSWIHEPGTDEGARPRSWTEGSGCDAWVFHTGTEDPLSTAAAWTRGEAARPDEYGEAIDRWVAYYEREGIEAVAFGGVVLRRRAGENWVRSVTPPRGGSVAAGAHLERLFAAVDLLETLDEEGVLALRPAPAPEARLEQTLAPAAGEWRVTGADLSLASGLTFRAGLDAQALALLLALDGRRTVAEALATVEAEPAAEDRAAAAGLVRRLLELGFLVAE